MVEFEDLYANVDDKVLELVPEEENEWENDYELSEEEINELNFQAQAEAAQILYDFDKAESNNFDNIVKKYAPLIGLRGDSYKHATKMIFYTILANQLKHNVFSYENKDIDLRLPLLVQLKAGHGKKNYVNFIKQTVLGCGKDYQEPISYHPEQFVGKIVVHESKKDGTTKYEPVYGSLHSDFLLIDEGYALLSRKENEECLKYIRTALDPIGQNTIEKKQVNVHNEHKLQYDPDCSIMVLTQPITKVNEELLVRGSMRRFIILFIDVSITEHLESLKDCRALRMRKDVQSKMFMNWLKFNEKLLACRDVDYVCTDENQLMIIKYITEDLQNSAKGCGQAVSEFFESLTFTIFLNIFKMATIRAILNRADIKSGMTVTIAEHHIKEAIEDWGNIWQPQVQWIARQLNVDSSSPLKWNPKTHGVIMGIADMFDGKPFTATNVIVEYKKRMPTLSDQALKNTTYAVLKDLYVWGYLNRRGEGKKQGYQFKVAKKYLETIRKD